MSKRVVAACALCLACTAIIVSQTSRRPVTSANSKSRATIQSKNNLQSFTQVSIQAAQTREAGRLDEAANLYRQAVAVRPVWAEGWWYVGTLAYNRNDFKEAANGFTEATKLQPKLAETWAMRGLSEFQLEAYADAFAHLSTSIRLGLTAPEINNVVRFHQAVLLNLQGDFESAQQLLDRLVYENPSRGSEQLTLALGLAVLRVPLLPNKLNRQASEFDLIRRAGLAANLAAKKEKEAARIAYEQLALDFAATPNVQYAFARYLYINDREPEALAAFEREMNNSPAHGFARLQIANIYLRNREPQKGLPYAEQAIKLYPKLMLGHFILGRLLYDTGDNARAITHLETAQRLAPEQPKIYFALARAYARAKRNIDAERARATFDRFSEKPEPNASNDNANIELTPRNESLKRASPSFTTKP